MKKKEGSISEALQAPSQNKVLLFFHTVHLVNQLRNKNDLIVSAHNEKRNSTALHVQLFVKARAAVREQGADLGSFRIIVQRISTTTGIGKDF